MHGGAGFESDYRKCVELEVDSDNHCSTGTPPIRCCASECPRRLRQKECVKNITLESYDLLNLPVLGSAIRLYF